MMPPVVGMCTRQGGVERAGQASSRMHVLWTSGLLLGQQRAEACQFGEVRPAWASQGQPHGSRPNKSTALSKL